MILRKPYAFFIKHFKLLHLILAIFMAYSIYKIKLLMDFFNEYSMDIINVTGQDLVSPLIPIFLQIVPILMIIVSVIILTVMIVKNKPKLFYILLIVLNLFSVIVIQMSKSTLIDMSKQLLDSRIVMLTRDLIILMFITQIISFVIVIVRATGFDIKKFDFKTDLKSLDINDKDKEEFEVNIEFDKNKFIRKIRNKVRFFKYSYKENKLLFNVIAGLICSIFICLIIFLMQPDYEVINQNNSFIASNFTMNIGEAYLTNSDYKGNILSEDDYFLILKVKIKSNTKKSVLDIATTKIKIDNYIYTPTINFRDSFFDFGSIYQGEEISTEFENKVLMYQIPKQLFDKEIKFVFSDKYNSSNKNIIVNIDYTNLLENAEIKTYNLTEKIEFNDSILSDYKIKIDAFDIQKKYKLSYDFCVNKECIKSYEYLIPNIASNYNKAILKLSGTLEKENNISSVYDLYDFIEKFGKLYYEIDGKEKVQNVKFERVVSKKASQTNIYYLEVLEEAMNADHIYIVFNIRNKNYKYILK